MLRFRFFKAPSGNLIELILRMPSRILLIDDDPAVPELVEAILADEGAAVTSASTAAEAVRCLGLSEFDLILLDLGLPDMSGFDLLQVLRSQEEFQRVPILLVSALYGTEDKVRCFDLGANDYISKPYAGPELRARVRSLLKMKLLQDQLRSNIEKLERARQAAEEATSAKSEFLAHMSHEIRTPMNGVLGMARLLMETALTTNQKELVDLVHTSASTLLMIVNDILDLSKIESGKMQLEKQPFNLRSVFEEVAGMLRPRADEKKIRFSIEINDAVPVMLVGDALRLRQILVNLAGNALKFTEAGQVTLHAHLTTPRVATSSRCSLHISVRDTGIGIPEDRMGLLFKSFGQTDASISRRFGGTGLGLTISKSLAELMGGRMWAESVHGQGSTFHFTAELEAVIPLLAIPESSPVSQLEGMKILIVEENLTSRRLLTLQTRRWSMQTECAESARQVLDLLKAGGRYDALLLDLQTPDMDGLALGEKIVRDFPTLNLPMILMTIGGEVPSGNPSAMACFVACLNKPLQPAQLVRALLQAKMRGMLGQVKAATAAGAVPARMDTSLATRFPLKVLVVDDNLINVKVATRLLQQMGYKSDSASNGAEAIKAAETGGYHLIFMDVQMPEMDGLEATRRIRMAEAGSGEGSHVIIVAMTANAMHGDRERCIASGMDDYVSKPVQPEKLQGALEKWGSHLAGKAAPPITEVSVQAATAAESSGQSMIDWERLRSFSDGTEENLRELVTLYVEQTELQMQQLRSAIAAGDWVVVKRVSHSAAGSSGTCGLARLNELFKQVEHALIESKADQVPALFAELEQCAPGVFAEMRQFLGAGAAVA